MLPPDLEKIEEKVKQGLIWFFVKKINIKTDEKYT